MSARRVVFPELRLTGGDQARRMNIAQPGLGKIIDVHELSMLGDLQRNTHVTSFQEDGIQIVGQQRSTSKPFPG
jgi:hypothetical protein